MNSEMDNLLQGGTQLQVFRVSGRIAIGREIHKALSQQWFSTRFFPNVCFLLKQAIG